MKRIAAPAVAATLALLAVAPGAGAATTSVKTTKASACSRVPLLIPICKTEQRKLAPAGRCGYRILFIPICRQQ
ncbi:MAG TPA: hypothetical protein VM266_00815 [Solirubrobacteraceae bacterium]|nr:hypothetical protein [Solirubrobacteraceae bacterium]